MNSISTDQLQSRIDDLPESGGSIFISESRSEIGTLVLKTGVTLTLEKNAVLVASPNYTDFDKVQTISEAEKSHSALLYAKNASDITVKGPGTLFGNGDEYFDKNIDAMGYRNPHKYRPRLIVFENCQNITLDGFKIEKAPMWNIHLVGCDKVVINNVTIDNDLTMPNTDGLDIDSCTNVEIRNCKISTADDGICIKTTKKADTEEGNNLQKECRNVSISHCDILSHSCAFKIGTETYYDISDVSLSECNIRDTNRAIGIVSRDGGHISNVSVSHVTLNCITAAACHWGKADPIFASVRHRDPGCMPGKIINFSLSNITGTMQGACNFHSEPADSIIGTCISDVTLHQNVARNYEKEQGLFDVRPPCNPNSPTGMGLDNAYLLDEKTGLPYGVEKYPGGLPCIFAPDVELELKHVNFMRPNPLPENWNKQTIIT